VNVLLAVDGSTQSEAAVIAVCSRFNPDAVTVRVLHVVEWPKNLAAPFSFVEGRAAADWILAAHETMRNDGRDLLARAVARLRDARFDVTPVLVEGDVRQGILDEAAAWPADLIVLGSHGRTGFNRLLLGSVSEAIVRHAPCSVEIVRDRRADAGQELAAAS
jgi:nucleotide-binding universal stress UspA family protein